MNCCGYHGRLAFSPAHCAGDCQAAHKARPFLVRAQAGIEVRKEGERSLVQEPLA
jgi:hypothetical protein